jgi:WD40 repeat protein
MKSLFIAIVLAGLSLATHGQQISKFELTAAGSEFFSVAINPDNRIIASGDQQGKIYLWDAESKALINTLVGHKERVLTLAFSHDGSFLASAGKDNTIIVWSTRHGIQEKILRGHSETITKLNFSADNKWLVSGSADKKVILWNFIKGEIDQILLESSKEISHVAFTHDGKILAVSGFDGTTTFWSTSNWKIQKKLSPAAGRIRSLAFSPDDRFVAIATEKKGVQIYEVYSGYLNKAINEHKDIVYDLQYSVDGRYLFTGSLDNTIRIYDEEKKQTIASLGPFYNFLSLTLSSNGKFLVVVDATAKLKLYDLNELHITPSVNKFRISNATLSDEIIIELLEPITPFDSVFFAETNKLSIKGRVLSKNGISELRINNRAIPVLENGFFQFEQIIPLGRWNIPITARDFNNNTITKLLITQRSSKPEDENYFRNGKDYALIIVTDQYDELNHLNNPVFDGQTIQIDLEELYGFETKVLTNPTKAQIQEEIRNYSKRNYSRTDQLFVFVAGHGVYDDIFKEGYIAARDSKSKDEVKDSYISYANFRNYVNNIPCQHIMVVLDVCFGGTFNPVVASRGQEDYPEMDRQIFILTRLKYTTRRYITSGGKHYVSDGIKGNHSPFARNFIEALRSRGGADGILTFNEVIPFIEKVEPGPTFGEFGSNEPGSDFMFILDQKKK